MTTGEIIIYQLPDGQTSIDVKLENESLWLSINQIAELFGRDKSVISRHLKSICSENELDRQATVAKNATVQNEAGRNSGRQLSLIAEGGRESNTIIHNSTIWQKIQESGSRTKR